MISTSNNHLVYAVYTALILLTAADGWLGTALAGGMSFGLLWAANALLPGTVFSFMLVLFPRIIAVGISMRTLIGRNEASRTLAALRNLRLPERLIMNRGGDFPLLPRSVGRHEVAAAIHPHPGRVCEPMAKVACAAILYRITDRADGFCALSASPKRCPPPPKHGAST